MTFIATPIDSAQEKAVEAFFKVLKVPYKKTKDENPYDPEFVAKIRRGEEAAKQGEGIKINVAELWK